MSTKGPAENHLKTGGETLEFQNKIEVTNKVSDACLDTFQAMKLRRKHRYIIFKLGEEEIEVESTGERKSVRTTVYIDFYDGLTNCNCFEQTFEAFKAALPFSDCRFCVYDQDYTTADGTKSTTFTKFIASCVLGYLSTLTIFYHLQVAQRPSYGSSVGSPTIATRTTRWRMHLRRASSVSVSLVFSTRRCLLWRSWI